jgi:hypothetical protein
MISGVATGAFQNMKGYILSGDDINVGSSARVSFGVVQGDEALMCLDTFWRNDRWHLLFPPIRRQHPRRN